MPLVTLMLMPVVAVVMSNQQITPCSRENRKREAYVEETLRGDEFFCCVTALVLPLARIVCFTTDDTTCSRNPILCVSEMGRFDSTSESSLYVK